MKEKEESEYDKALEKAEMKLKESQYFNNKSFNDDDV